LRLAELVDACGVVFGMLEWGGKQWFTSGGKDEDCGCNCKFEENATSPEEAVARLWLALYEVNK
jgi:hypothetical protein